MINGHPTIKIFARPREPHRYGGTSSAQICNVARSPTSCPLNRALRCADAASVFRRAEAGGAHFANSNNDSVRMDWEWRWDVLCQRRQLGYRLRSRCVLCVVLSLQRRATQRPDCKLPRACVEQCVSVT